MCRSTTAAGPSRTGQRSRRRARARRARRRSEPGTRFSHEQRTNMRTPYRLLALTPFIIAVWIATVVAQQPLRQAPRTPSASPSGSQSGKKLALAGGMLITGYEVPPIHHAVVLIEGNKITAAGPASEIRIPPDATVVDTSGRAMLPGLIEAHGHLVVLGHGDYATWFPWIKAHGGDAMQMKVMEIAARQLLMAGVTTTVDLGAPLKPILAIRDRINKGEVVGTRVLASGPWISRGSGGAMQDGFGGQNISSSEEAGQKVEELAKAGVDHIKAHSGLLFDDYKAIAAAAHKNRIRVHAHVYSESDVRHALDAGIDVLQHVGSAGTAPPYSPQLITDIVN